MCKGEHWLSIVLLSSLIVHQNDVKSDEQTCQVGYLCLNITHHTLYVLICPLIYNSSQPASGDKEKPFKQLNSETTADIRHQRYHSRKCDK